MDNRAWLYKGLGLFSLFCLLAVPPHVYGSSFLGSGLVIQANPVDGRDLDRGRCYLFLGPHGDFLGENEFLLQLGDDELEDGFDTEVLGSFVFDKRGRIRSFVDDEAVESFFQGFVDKQVGRDDLEAKIRDVIVKVRRNRRLGDEVIRCRATIRVDLLDGNTLVDKITLRYSGVGLHFEDFHGTFQEDSPETLKSSSSPVALPQSSSLSAAASGSCPIPELVPPARNPVTNDTIVNFCEPKSCLVNFAGFQWWTNYQWSLQTGYYNGGLATRFNPAFVFKDAEGLHLRIMKSDVGDGFNWAGSEVVAMFNESDGSPAKLGHGTYLVSAKVKSAPSWDQLDRNIAFGVFTFEKDKRGTVHNPYRELDLAEISRWGQIVSECTISDTRIGCQGNSQFALQIWDAEKANIFRYTINAGVTEVTLVMKWNGANQPVTFQQYNGSFGLGNLPAAANTEWTTPVSQNKFVPDSDCQRFHLNFWLGNYSSHPTPHPGPSNGQDQEIVITNFQYQPLN
jgi:hypothetical protein